MRFNGDLSDGNVSGLLSAVAKSAQSGKLRLSNRDGEAVVLFDRGRISYAATQAGRETFGSILVAQKKITPRQLDTALELQQSMGTKSLGSIFVQLSMVSQYDVRGALREQTARVLADLVTWTTGQYEFVPLTLDLPEYTSLPLSEVLPTSGEEPFSAEPQPEAPEGIDEPFPLIRDRRPTRRAPDPSTWPTADAEMLREISTTVRSPEITGELVAGILKAARETVDRAVLFLMRPDGFQGISQSGVESPEDDVNQSIRGLFIPADIASILKAAADRQGPVLQELDVEAGDELLARALGGKPPKEGVAIPMTTSGKVLSVLYGDNVPSGKPIDSLDDLELVLMEAGMTMEKALLRKRREQLDTLRGISAEPIGIAEQED